MEGRVLAICSVMIILIAVSAVPGEALGKTVDPPRKQMARGVAPQDVVCREGLVLAITPSGAAICVSQKTAAELERRGFEIVTSGQDHSIDEGKTYADAEQPAKIRAGSDAKIETVPASAGTVVNFYVTDDDLNASPNGMDVVSTEGLLEFTVNGVSIDGPDTMIETGPNTGKFYVRLQLPDTVNGRAITQDDIIQTRYIDQSDSAGEQRIATKSVALSQTYAQMQTAGGGSRIGHEFSLRIYEPDANLDSKEVDRIPLSRLEYRGEGGIRASLSSAAFDANASALLETGPDTGVFEVKIKIPRTIGGKTVHIGDWYEITYVDASTPSGTSEDVVLRGRIG